VLNVYLSFSMITAHSNTLWSWQIVVHDGLPNSDVVQTVGRGGSIRKHSTPWTRINIRLSSSLYVSFFFNSFHSTEQHFCLTDSATGVHRHSGFSCNAFADRMRLNECGDIWLQLQGLPHVCTVWLVMQWTLKWCCQPLYFFITDFSLQILTVTVMDLTVLVWCIMWPVDINRCCRGSSCLHFQGCTWPISTRICG
jgi:hypothetical protein